MTTSPCFTPGAQIATETGWRAVECLQRGDRVVTRDNGLRKIAWVGQRTFRFDELAQAPELRPVLVRRGSFGNDTPTRDFLVSPRHRFLTVTSAADAEEELIAAGALTFKDGITFAPTLGVTYLHVLLEAHEVIMADGVWTESFHPDDQTLMGLSRDTRSEILALFPEIETLGAARRFPPARKVLQSRFER